MHVIWIKILNYILILLSWYFRRLHQINLDILCACSFLYSMDWIVWERILVWVIFLDFCVCFIFRYFSFYNSILLWHNNALVLNFHECRIYRRYFFLTVIWINWSKLIVLILLVVSISILWRIWTLILPVCMIFLIKFCCRPILLLYSASVLIFHFLKTFSRFRVLLLFIILIWFLWRNLIYNIEYENISFTTKLLLMAVNNSFNFARCITFRLRVWQLLNFIVPKFNTRRRILCRME